MFGLFKSQSSARTEVFELQCQKAELERIVQHLNIQLDEAKRNIAKILDQTTEAEPVIDFDRARVFSIERCVNDGKPCTIVGMWVNYPVFSSDGEMIVKRDESKEWVLYCNEGRHTDLVKQFKKWKETQRG